MANPTREDPTSAQGDAGAGVPATILVVDDDPAMRRLISTVLSQAGYRVTEAGDGLEALASIQQQPPAGILLDVMMPGMGGLEVCRRLKGDPATAAIPVALVSALADAGHREEGLEAGADEFIGKPVHISDLLAVVRRVITPDRANDQG
jgi:CheY-like chemotaxis protein